MEWVPDKIEVSCMSGTLQSGDIRYVGSKVCIVGRRA